MNKLLTLSGLLLSAHFISAQTVERTVVSSDGGFSQNSQGSIAWSIGEPVSETYVTSGNITTMGFLQPETVTIPTLIKEQGNDKQILIFPNPVKDELSIDFTGFNKGRYQMELTDALGKLIYKSEADVSEDNNRFNIKLGEVAAGAYFLKVHNADFNKTVKINKVN